MLNEQPQGTLQKAVDVAVWEIRNVWQGVATLTKSSKNSRGSWYEGSLPNRAMISLRAKGHVWLAMCGKRSAIG